MGLGLIGRKSGMTRVLVDTDQGRVFVAATVIEVLPNAVTQIRTPERDGYAALQLSFGEKKLSRVSRSVRGHYTTSGVLPGLMLHEFRVSPESLSAYQLGQTFDADLFEQGALVDVCGTSRGKGFAGTIKRHHFAGQDRSHGNSLSHRVPGSIGQRQTPGRVFKGKRMSGRMGADRRTVQSLKVLDVRKDLGLLVVKGAVPGAPGGFLWITPSVKSKKVS